MTSEVKELFRIKKLVTVPHLKFEAETPYYLKFLSAMVDMEKTTPTRAARVKKDALGNVLPPTVRKMAPPIVAKVLNLVDKKPYQIILNAMLEGLLEDSYPEDSYVDKCFRIILHTKAAGKDYHTFEVAEIEVEDPSAPVAAGKKS
jgi:hypothetical protein